MTKLISLLTVGMFGTVSGKTETGAWTLVRPTVHPMAYALQRLIREGQCLTDDTFHNAGWYNKLGEKIGWGDLSVVCLQNIPRLLPPGEVFVVLSEGDSHWQVPKGTDPNNPGLEYLASIAMAVATPTGWYVLPRFSEDLIPYNAFAECKLRGKVQARKAPRDYIRKLLEVASTLEVDFDNDLVITPVEGRGSTPPHMEDLLPLPWKVGVDNWGPPPKKMDDGRWRLPIYRKRTD